jgi:hypothetical protein
MTSYSKKVTTPKFRVGYHSVFNGQVNDQGKRKFDLTMVFEPGQDLSALEKAVKEAIAEEWGEKPPKNIKTPFKRHTDEGEDGERYCDKMPDLYTDDEDAVFVRGSTYNPPGIIDRERNYIMEDSDFYSGCYARATVVAATYELQSGKKGVTLYVNNIQKLDEGDAIGGVRTKAEDDFEALDEAASVNDLF